MTAQHGYLAGKRTDQFIPYGMAGLQGSRTSTRSRARTTRRPRRSRRATLARRQGRLLRVQPRAGAARRPVGAVQPEADRARRRDQAVRPRRAEHEGRHRVVSRSTSRTRVGTPTIRIRRTSSTCCSTAAGSRPRTTSTRRTSRATASPTTRRSSTPPSRPTGSKRLDLYAALDRDIMANGAPTAHVHLRHDAPLLQPERRMLRLERAGGHRSHHHLQEVARPVRSEREAPSAPPAPP